VLQPSLAPDADALFDRAILIVDDLAENRKLLRVLLEAEAFKTVEAADGAEALCVLAREKIGGIISDILMPNMDGYRLCYEVRTNPQFCHLPFIIYTATYTAAKDERVAMEVGADKFLTKPAGVAAIIDALSEAAKAGRIPLQPMESSQQLTVIKGYSERLVAKLEERNIELAERLVMLAQTEVKLRRSETRYRRLFESAQDGILILDGDTGEILDINLFLLDLLDYPIQKMVGRKLWEIAQFKDIASDQREFQRLQESDYIRCDDILQTKAGNQIPVEFVSNVYLVDGKKIIQCNMRDISARAKVEEASHTQLTNLEIANTAKDEFLAALSHELRTPLTAIASMLDLLALNHNVSGGQETSESPFESDPSSLELIRRNVQMLGHLVNELLDLTQVSRGDIHLEIELIDAHAAIGNLIRDFAPSVETKKIDMAVHLDADRHHLNVDAVKFQQILGNLISNAIKFTPSGGKIRVATVNTSNDLVMEVGDSGIGLPADFAAHIFTPFDQGNATIRRRFGGLGLGLSISRKLAEAHGGMLEARSDGLNQGSTFSLRFTSADAPLPKKVDLITNPPRIGPKHILLVEDHADTRHCMCRLLESRGHQVECAQDADSAIALENKDNHFDVLITDIGLPDRTGVELLQELRIRRPDFPAIAMSGFGMPRDLLRSRKAGFLDHFVKPVDLTKLYALIDTIGIDQESLGKRTSVWATPSLG
jgi:PAS domain S-box-containing protein